MKPDSQASLQDWIDWLLSLHSQEIDLGIERVRQVASRLKLLNPMPQVITVAGTNGKGSSVAMLSSIYRYAGYQVGTYTSPHLQHFNERIQVKGQMVSDQEIVNAFVEIEKAREDIKLTYFEFSTLAALWVFKQYSLDVIVLEVGLGGRLDAVNIIDADAMLITAIDIDHADWLGSDRSVIAVEKAGIMREGRPAICSDRCVPDSLIDYADQLGVSLELLGRDFEIELQASGWAMKGFAETQPRLFNYPSLSGSFQVENASGVVRIIDALLKALPINDMEISQGLRQTLHPGRLQKIEVGSQQWLLDVAHNPQSAEALSDYLREIDFHGNAVFSVLADKDYLPMIKMISPFVDHWYIASLKVPRAEKVNHIEQMLRKVSVPADRVEMFDSISEAIDGALAQQAQKWLCFGSLFTVGQAMATQRLTS